MLPCPALPCPFTALPCLNDCLSLCKSSSNPQHHDLHPILYSCSSPQNCIRLKHGIWSSCYTQGAKPQMCMFVHIYCHKVAAAAHLDLLSTCLIASKAVKHSLLADCLACLQDRLVQWDFLKSWSPEAHQSYPAKFKEVAKLLLLASVQSSSKGSPRQSGVTQQLPD